MRSRTVCNGFVLAVVAGLAGAIVGWALKTASDRLAERRAAKRSDLIWRRQHYVDAVGTLIHAGRELMSADSSISRATFSLVNAEAGGNAAIIDACRAGHREALDRQLPWTTATTQALELVRLYAPTNVVEQADAAWNAILNDGRLPDVHQVPSYEAAVTAAFETLRSETRTTAGLS